PDLPLLYQPAVIDRRYSSDGQNSSIFAMAETEEFQHQNFAAATAAYEQLTGSRTPAVRAGALLRLARVLRKRGDSAAALQAYSKLAELGSIPVGGDPASLIARQGRAKIFEERGAAEELHQEAAELARILY